MFVFYEKSDGMVYCSIPPEKALYIHSINEMQAQTIKTNNRYTLILIHLHLRNMGDISSLIIYTYVKRFTS